MSTRVAAGYPGFYFFATCVKLRPNAFVRDTTKLTVEDCRRKAAELLGAAEAATHPKTSASLRRTAELWTALALQIEQDPYSRRHPPAAVRRPADLAARPKIGNTDTANVADVLRERLQLSDFDKPRS